MTLETGTYISDLVATNPLGSDAKSTADDHIRLIKSTVKATFPNVTGAVTPTHTQLNYVTGVTSAIQTQIDTKGAHAGQVWTGTHNFTGATLTYATQSQGDNSTKGATTSYVDTGLALKGNINAQTWTGTHTFSGACVVPTMTAGDNSTNAASTAFTSAAIAAAAFSSALPSQSGNSGKFVTTNGTTASWATVNTGLELIATTTASGVAAVDFTTGINSTYDAYLFVLSSVVPATTSTRLYMRTSSNGGSSFDAGATDYAYVMVGVDDAAGTLQTNSGGTTQILINQKQVGASHSGLNANIYLYKPSTSQRCQVTFNSSALDNGGLLGAVSGAGSRQATGVVNAVRFLFSSGNIASGEFKLYGLKKS